MQCYFVCMAKDGVVIKIGECRRKSHGQDDQVKDAWSKGQITGERNLHVECMVNTEAEAIKYTNAIRLERLTAKKW